MNENNEDFNDGLSLWKNEEFMTHLPTSADCRELKEAVEELEIMFRQLETIHDNTGYVDNSDFVGIDANLDNMKAAIKRVRQAAWNTSPKGPPVEQPDEKTLLDEIESCIMEGLELREPEEGQPWIDGTRKAAELVLASLLRDGLLKQPSASPAALIHAP